VDETIINQINIQFRRGLPASLAHESRIRLIPEAGSGWSLRLGKAGPEGWARLDQQAD